MDKVLHILPMNKVSGAERMALLICKNMKGFEPVVVCGGNELKKVFEENYIKSYSLDFAMKNIIFTVSGLRKIINDNNVKIVHAHDNTASLVAYLTKKSISKDIKVVSHIHSCYPWLKENGTYKKIDKLTRNKYDLNIMCGDRVKDFYNENTNYISDKNVKILSNAIETELSCNKEKDKILKQYNIPNDKVLLGFVGRLSPIKGLIPFITELIKNKKKFEDCIILIAGSGELESEIKELIKQSDMKEEFILTGFVEDTNSLYKVIDILLLPSLYEGLPMVILEAMLFKTPIISMDVGGISEVVKDNTGILVESKNYKKFIEEIVKLKADKKRCSYYAKNGRRFIEDNYNIDNYIGELEIEYKKMIEEII